MNVVDSEQRFETTRSMFSFINKKNTIQYTMNYDSFSQALGMLSHSTHARMKNSN